LFILLFIDAFDPLFDAFEVHGNAAATAGPNVVFTPDFFRAYNAMHFVVAALAFNKSRSIQLCIVAVIVFPGLLAVMRLWLGLFWDVPSFMFLFLVVPLLLRRD
jgi:hypothetical protein